jgi:DNA replication protein DnaC
MKDINEIAAKLANGMTLEDLRKRQSGDRLPIKPKTPEQIETESAYWTKVFADQPERHELYITRSTAQEMGYEEARRKFWAILQLRAAHIAIMEGNTDWQWCFDESMSAVVRNLVKYFINDSSGTYPLTKGLFVFGQNGTGKTEIMSALERFCYQYNLTKQFRFGSMSEVYNRTRSDKDYDPIADNQQFDRCFDEFGRQVGPVLRFGDPLDINESVIEARYGRFQRYGQITHFISNSTPNEAQAQFSPMVFDRLRAMCTSVIFSGESKRK